jgi:hypothetical protein
MASRTILQVHADEIIRLTKKYFATSGDINILPALHKAENTATEAGTDYYCIGLVGDLARIARHGNQTYQQIYAALGAMGYTVKMAEPKAPEEQ